MKETNKIFACNAQRAWEEILLQHICVALHGVIKTTLKPQNNNAYNARGLCYRLPNLLAVERKIRML